MKLKLNLTVITFCMMLFQVFSQVKIYPGGNTYIGSIAASGPIEKLQVIGNAVFSSSTSALFSAPYIIGHNNFSHANSPDYTWKGDSLTGIFHAAAGLINFSTNANERFRIDWNGQLLSVNAPGTAANPDFSWLTETNTGIYRSTGGGAISFSVLGNEKFRINSYGQLCNANGTSTAVVPDFTWVGNPNTGIFHPIKNSIAISAAGIEKMRVSTGADNIQINGAAFGEAQLNIKSSHKTDIFPSGRAIWCDVTTNADFDESIVTNIDRVESGNYVVKLNKETNFFVSGSGWVYNAGGIYSGSDLSLKSNVATINSALQKVLAMRGVTYKLKKEVANPTFYGTQVARSYIGVIAQEVEAVAPELVRDMPNGTKAVNYQNMVGLLIQAMKEQNSRIDSLKKQINICCAAKTAAGMRIISPETIDNPTEAKQANRAYLAQNKPNPFSQTTTINYFVPDNATAAELLVFDLNGKLLKSMTITIRGEGNLIIDAKQLQPGMYLYSLLIDGKEIDTKRMILTDN